MSEYAEYPGGENFEPWQDHEWPTHCGEPARYVGEVGSRELALVAEGASVLDYVRDHLVDGAEYIVEEAIPPHAPKPGEAWDSTLHEFRCVACSRHLLLWDAN